MDGAFYVTKYVSALNNASVGDLKGYRSDMDASRVVLTAEENRPVNVALPVILYLGLTA